MLGLLTLCFTIYLFTYFTIRSEGTSIEVEPIRSFDDYFFDYRKNRIGDDKDE